MRTVIIANSIRDKSRLQLRTVLIVSPVHDKSRL